MLNGFVMLSSLLLALPFYMNLANIDFSWHLKVRIVSHVETRLGFEIGLSGSWNFSDGSIRKLVVI